MTLQLYFKVVSFGGTNMIKLTKANLSQILLLTIAAGLFFSNPIDINTPTVVEASTLTFTITQSNFPTLSTNTLSTSEVIGSITVSGVQIDLGIKNSTRTTTGTPSLDMKGNASALYNINPLPGTVNSIVIRQKTGQSNTLHVGSTGRIINATAGNYNLISGTSIGSISESSRVQTFDGTSFPTLANNSDLSYFAFLPSGGTDTSIESIAFTMTVASIVATSGETYTFAIDFLAATVNKSGVCTDAGLQWSFSSVSPAETISTANPVTLEGQFSKLTDTQKTAFRTDTTDSQILAARERYVYLRSFNPLLTNFAGI
jgi:hypothetical protein